MQRNGKFGDCCLTENSKLVNCIQVMSRELETASKRTVFVVTTFMSHHWLQSQSHHDVTAKQVNAPINAFLV